jgi:hypothetical protein
MAKRLPGRRVWRASKTRPIAPSPSTRRTRYVPLRMEPTVSSISASAVPSRGHAWKSPG